MHKHICGIRDRYVWNNFRSFSFECREIRLWPLHVYTQHSYTHTHRHIFTKPVRHWLISKWCFVSLSIKRTLEDHRSWPVLAMFSLRGTTTISVYFSFVEWVWTFVGFCWNKKQKILTSQIRQYVDVYLDIGFSTLLNFQPLALCFSSIFGLGS